MPPKPSPPANFTALRRYARISHSVAHSRESHYPDISRDLLLAQQAAHDAKLTEAITDVRRKIIDEEMSLSNVTPTSFTICDFCNHDTDRSLQMHSQQTIPDSPDPDVPEPPYKKLRKLKVLKAAHDQGFQTVDYIPPADSSLNILLAYRSVGSVISQTNASIQTVEEQVKAAQALLKAEEGTLKEQKRLTEALRTRLDTLEEEDRQIDIGADIVGQGDMIKQMGKKKKEFVKRTVKLLREFLYFLDAGLARMVAAEEMGGPVVGDDLDVTLETGFDKKGKSKKGDRRIDEMWGQAEENPETKVAQEFKDLLEVSVFMGSWDVAILTGGRN